MHSRKKWNVDGLLKEKNGQVFDWAITHYSLYFRHKRTIYRKCMVLIYTNRVPS